jgi:hypothetical protein
MVWIAANARSFEDDRQFMAAQIDSKRKKAGPPLALTRPEPALLQGWTFPSQYGFALNTKFKVLLSPPPMVTSCVCSP